MSEFINTLNSVALSINVYAGLTQLGAGIVGNLLTIVVLSQAPLRSTRTSVPLMTLAVMNTIFLSTNLVPLVIAGIRHEFDTTFGIQIYCCFRFLIAYTTLMSIVFLLSWIAFDR